MYIWESIKIGFMNLKVNPLRSWLTMLGVIIGVAAVITVVAFGEGNRRKVEQEIAKMGADVFWITVRHEKIDFSDYEQMMKFRGYRSLTRGDIESLRQYGTQIGAVAPIMRSSYTINFGGICILFDVTGTEPDYQRIRRVKLIRGRFLNESDLRHRRNVCIIEESPSSNKLFGGARSVGARHPIGRKKV